MNSGAKSLARSVFRAAASSPWSRSLLNVLYLKLSPSQRALFHQRFAKVFRNGGNQGRDGHWKVIFGGKPISMPLRRGSFWLDWDNAVSIVGHDIEVKQTYESLIASPSARPDLFIDIGANYGTHSLLFLVHGIEVVTFEPNTSCHEYFRLVCDLNDVRPRLKPLALGEAKGYVEFSYPKRDTWLGSTHPEVIERLQGSKDLVTEKVEQRTLDDFYPEIGDKRTLIKMDTEGNELSVLKGANKILKETRPRIIFECFTQSEKNKLFELFAAERYSVYPLPWRPNSDAGAFSGRQFGASSATNFIAVPAGAR